MIKTMIKAMTKTMKLLQENEARITTKVGESAHNIGRK